MTPIYPEVEILHRGDNCSLRTYIRKELDGIWYLWPVYRDHKGHLDDVSVKEFYFQVYLVDKLGIVQPDSINFYGLPHHPRDNDQTSEQERLFKTYPFLKHDSNNI